jgi:hypothetical protein
MDTNDRVITFTSYINDVEHTIQIPYSQLQENNLHGMVDYIEGLEWGVVTPLNPTEYNRLQQWKQKIIQLLDIPTIPMSNPTKIRARTGSPHYAELAANLDKAREVYGDRHDIFTLITQTEPAKPGDTWRLTWSERGGNLAGYAICCPKCKQVHYWAQANNCTADVRNGVCKHARATDGGELGSCWQWTGTAEDGTLTAQPSLFASGVGECGYHGWLSDGVLTEV